MAAATGKSEVVGALVAGGLIPVIRADSADAAIRTSEALVEGGIRTLEITMTVPDAIGAIRAVSAALGGDALIGAGTVTTHEMAVRALDAGARFLVSPALVRDVLAVARERGVPALPGALTPTEVLEAHALGGDIIKIFPASAVGGAAYLRALKGPLPHIDFCPTGGVNLDTIGGFFEAGAVAVGVGGELVLKSAIAKNEFGRITELARRYVDAVARARG
jgi:2-dehydro-3-deoxyphosphogluconate aldolase/(4S)-4-hydroxy-2-oxoglutarate aldolase